LYQRTHNERHSCVYVCERERDRDLHQLVQPWRTMKQLQRLVLTRLWASLWLFLSSLLFWCFLPTAHSISSDLQMLSLTLLWKLA
jgi:hypothetical protein